MTVVVGPQAGALGSGGIALGAHTRYFGTDLVLHAQ